MKTIGSVIAAMLLAATGILFEDDKAGAEDPASATIVFVSTFPLAGPMTTVTQFDLVQQILEFPKDGATREHSHGGNSFVTVLEGEVVRLQEGKETPFSQGQTFIEGQGVVHSVRNTGSGKARNFASFLLAAGAQQTTNVVESPVPPVPAAAAFLSRATIVMPPGPLAVVQVVFDFAPGTVLPKQSRGSGILMVIEGELTFGEGADTAKRAPGGIFDGDPALGGIRNDGSVQARAVATYLVPQSVSSTTNVPQGTLTQPPMPSPPSTGEAGLAEQPSTLWRAWILVALVAVIVVIIAAAWQTRRS